MAKHSDSRPRFPTKKHLWPTKKHLWFGIRLIITITLCWWIATQVDWQLLASKLYNASPWLIALVIGLGFVNVAFSSYKWQQLLLMHGLAYPLTRLVRWYLIATFLSRALPTNIGGDAYRIYKTLNNTRGKTCAVLAVIADRLTGLVTLLLMGYVAALISWGHTGHPLSANLAALGTAGLIGGLLTLFVLVRWSLMPKLAGIRIGPMSLSALIKHAGEYVRDRRRSAMVMVISLLFHSNRILCMWLLVKAVDASCQVTDLAVALAAMTVIGLLPISIGGLGLVDGAFIVIMGQYGLPQEAALSAMLLTRALVLPIHLLGAVLYFRGDREKLPRREAQDLVRNAG